MKKVFALVLALALVCSMATVAMAEPHPVNNPTTLSITPAVTLTSDGFVDVAVAIDSTNNSLALKLDETGKLTFTGGDATVAIKATNSSIASEGVALGFDGTVNMQVSAFALDTTTVFSAVTPGANATNIANDGGTGSVTLTYAVNNIAHSAAFTDESKGTATIEITTNNRAS